MAFKQRRRMYTAAAGRSRVGTVVSGASVRSDSASSNAIKASLAGARSPAASAPSAIPAISSPLKDSGPGSARGSARGSPLNPHRQRISEDALPLGS